MGVCDATLPSDAAPEMGTSLDGAGVIVLCAEPVTRGNNRVGVQTVLSSKTADTPTGNGTVMLARTNSMSCPDMRTLLSPW